MITEFLTNLSIPTLEDVAVHFLVSNGEVISELGQGMPLGDLEKALLAFPRQRLSFRLMAQAYPRKSIWTTKIMGCFPMLREREGLIVICEPGEFDLCSMIADKG